MRHRPASLAAVKIVRIYIYIYIYGMEYSVDCGIYYYRGLRMGFCPLSPSLTETLTPLNMDTF